MTSRRFSRSKNSFYSEENEVKNQDNYYSRNEDNYYSRNEDNYYSRNEDNY